MGRPERWRFNHGGGGGGPTPSRGGVVPGGGLEHARPGYGLHEPGHAAEDEADADQGAERPDRAGGPVGEDAAGQQKRDQTVDKEPDRPGQGAEAEEDGELEDAFYGEVAAQDESEGEDAGDGREQEREGGDQVHDSEEHLPEDGPCATLRPGVAEVEDGAEKEQPAQQEAGGDGGEEGKNDGQQAGDEQQGSGQLGPAGRIGGGCEWAHDVLLRLWG